MVIQGAAAVGRAPSAGRCYYIAMRYTSERSTDPGLLVLSSLADGPKHGYAITQDVEDLIGVRLGPGTLYGALARLEQKGLIAALPAEDRRRPYRLTSQGSLALKEQLRALDRVVSTRPAAASHRGGSHDDPAHLRGGARPLPTRLSPPLRRGDAGPDRGLPGESMGWVRPPTRRPARPPAPEPSNSANVGVDDRLRASSSAVLACWVAFAAAGFGFYKTTEDQPFSRAGDAHLALGGSHLAVQVLAVLGSIAVLTGALPLLIAALRQATAIRSYAQPPALHSVAWRSLPP